MNGFIVHSFSGCPGGAARPLHNYGIYAKLIAESMAGVRACTSKVRTLHAYWIRSHSSDSRTAALTCPAKQLRD